MDFAFPVLQPTAEAPGLAAATSTTTASPASSNAATTSTATEDHSQGSRVPLTALSTVTHVSSSSSATAPRLPLTAFSTVTHVASTTAPKEPSDTSASATTGIGTNAGTAAAQAIGGKQRDFDKGARSQVEYLRSQVGALGVTGPSGCSPLRAITLDELKEHSTASDAWVCIRGRVYDITRYMQYHPGGARVLLNAAGTDATELFNKFHRWVDAQYILASSQLGTLAKDESKVAEEVAAPGAGQGRDCATC